MYHNHNKKVYLKWTQAMQDWGEKNSLKLIE